MIKEFLINQNGQPDFGYFPDGVRCINYMDYDLRSVMDRPLTKYSKKVRFNQFQFIGITCPELVVGVAIVDLQFLSNCFVYLYHPPTGQYEEVSFLQPLAMNTRFDSSPIDGISSFRKGNNRVVITATGQHACRSVQASLDCGIKINIDIDEAMNRPLSLCSRAGYQGWVFTQKSTALSCSGRCEWRGNTWQLEAIGGLAAVDWSAGYMRRETFWNWGSLSCQLEDRRRLGFNLAAGVNETGFTENGLWLDSSFHNVGPVDFQFDRYHQNKRWVLCSHDDVINLEFEPIGKRKEKINAIFLASNFTQHFGKYYGDLNVGGEIVRLKGEWGFAEDHYARW